MLVLDAIKEKWEMLRDSHEKMYQKLESSYWPEYNPCKSIQK
jgi:hypothetical protein